MSARRRTAAAMLAVEASARRRLRAIVLAVAKHHARGGASTASSATVAAASASRDIATAVAVTIDHVRDEAARAGVDTIDSELAPLREDHRARDTAIAAALLWLLWPGASEEAAKRRGARFSSQTIADRMAERYFEATVQRIDVVVRASVVKTKTQASEPIILPPRPGVVLTPDAPVGGGGGGPYRATAARPADALVDAAASVRSSIDTIAATEVAATFDEARASALAGILARDPSAADALEEEWSAVLDAAVCPTCAALHGRRAPLGGSWGGYRPGRVHPRCRCISFVVPRRMTQRLAA